MPPSVPVERRANQLIQLVGLCTFAAADRTDVQTPRDLITPANAKRQAGGRRTAGGVVVETCIEIDSRSAPAHSKLPAVEDGPHLGGDAIPRHKGTAAGRQAACQALAP
jgi:hypothetical protein